MKIFYHFFVLCLYDKNYNRQQDNSKYKKKKKNNQQDKIYLQIKFWLYG